MLRGQDPPFGRRASFLVVIGPLCSCTSQLHDTSGGTWRNTGISVRGTMKRCACARSCGSHQPIDIRLTATLPMVLGGLGLRSATRVRQAAYWSSWADCLPMVHHRQPMVAATLVAQLSGNPETRCLSRQCGRQNMSWQLKGSNHRRGRPLLVEPAPPGEPEDHEPGTVRRGWQHEAASVVEERAREAMFTGVSDQVKALVRSQGGPGAGAPFTATPTCRETTIPSHLFRVLLLRRRSSTASPRGSCMPMWPSPRLFWVPSCCMSSCWGAEPSGFLVGERSRPHLQRG